MSEFHNLNNNQQVVATNIALKSSANNNNNNNNNNNLSSDQSASEQELILSKLANRSLSGSIEDPQTKVFVGSTELQVSAGGGSYQHHHKHSSSSASSTTSSAGSAVSMLSSASRKQHRHHHHHHHHQQHQQQQHQQHYQQQQHSVSHQHLAGPNSLLSSPISMHHSTSQLSQAAAASGGAGKLLLQQPGTKQSGSLHNQGSRQSSHVAGVVDRSDSASLPSSTSTSNSMFKHSLGRDRKWRKFFTCGASASSGGTGSSTRLAPMLLLLLLLLLVLLGLALHLRLFGLSISCNLYGTSKQTEGFNLKNGAEFYLGITEMLQAMDSNVDPCHDFYNYACGTWTRRHSIPGDESRIDTFSVMRTDLGNKLKDLLEEDIEATDSEATLKAKTLYRSCVNESFIDKRGPEPLIQLLNSQFGGWPLLYGSGATRSEDVNWVKLMAILRTYNNEIIIGQTVGSHEHNSSMHAIRLYPAGLGLPSADYYNASSRQFKAYERYLISTAQLLKANNSNLMQDIRDVLEFETGLANISKPFERQGGATYHRMSIARLQKYTPAIDWDTYFQYAFPDLSINGSEQIGLYGLDFFMDIAHLINTTSNKRTVINYLLWRFVMNRVNNLGKQFADNQHEYAAEISGAKVQAPRHKVCVDYVNGNMGFAVSSLYVRRHFDASSKQQAEVMITNIRQAFLEILNQVDWMDAETRAEAIVKAKSMLQHIGFPLWIIEPSQLDAEYQHLNFSGDHYFENVIQLIQSFAKESRMKLRQPSERDKWTVAPSIINAHYLRTKNLMSFPAGILQPPIYHTRYPKSLNYGGIGSIIGHEITHGFDNDGRHHDYQGNQRLWWHPNTIDRFIIRSQCMVRQYDDYNVEIRGENISVSGIRTLGENIADNGGLKEAFMAYRRYEQENGPEDTLPGLNLTHHQMFFIKFAQNWCQNMTPQSMLNALKTWRHPLGRFRVLGTLSNLNEFSTAFNCPANTPMNPVNKCKVW